MRRCHDVLTNSHGSHDVLPWLPCARYVVCVCNPGAGLTSFAASDSISFRNVAELLRPPEPKDKTESLHLGHGGETPRESAEKAQPQSSQGRHSGDVGQRAASTTRNAADVPRNAPPCSSAVAVPVELLCAINGHIMRQPVRARHRPGGPVFERDTIEKWLDRAGSVCPISGTVRRLHLPSCVKQRSQMRSQTLMKADLVTDKALEARITQWHIQRALSRQAQLFVRQLMRVHSQAPA